MTIESPGGSPPHTWRILRTGLMGPAAGRITSTHVENTLLFVAVHDLLTGSPPHTWRIPVFHDEALIPARITSTHVENTQLFYDNDYSVRKGSPPHTWRIPDHAPSRELSKRITSTHVENTVNKSQYNNNHKTIDPKISSLCQLLLYLFLSH